MKNYFVKVKINKHSLGISYRSKEKTLYIFMAVEYTDFMNDFCQKILKNEVYEKVLNREFLTLHRYSARENVNKLLFRDFTKEKFEKLIRDLKMSEVIKVEYVKDIFMRKEGLIFTDNKGEQSV